METDYSSTFSLFSKLSDVQDEKIISTAVSAKDNRLAFLMKVEVDD